MPRPSSLLPLLFFISAVHSNINRVDGWNPTERDWTERCKKTTRYAPVEEKCQMFEECCVLDPLNGDKCQSMDRVCEMGGDEQIDFKCKLFNCTELITTTTTTTTQASPVNSQYALSSLSLSVAVFFSLSFL